MSKEKKEDDYISSLSRTKRGKWKRPPSLLTKQEKRIKRNEGCVEVITPDASKVLSKGYEVKVIQSHDPQWSNIHNDRLFYPI